MKQFSSSNSPCYTTVSYLAMVGAKVDRQMQQDFGCCWAVVALTSATSQSMSLVTQKFDSRLHVVAYAGTVLLSLQ
jgi:hypothetical protein